MKMKDSRSDARRGEATFAELSSWYLNPSDAIRQLRSICGITYREEGRGYRSIRTERVWI